MRQFNGNYLGIVIQNNDPEFRGRIKVWVPHISATLYDKWNKTKKNRKFRFPGQNLSSDLSQDIIDELKAILPWADYCAPNMGATGSGRYHAFDDKATISDSNVVATTQTTTLSASDPIFAKYKLNTDSIGEKPGRLYEAKESRIADDFVDTSKYHSKYVNKYGNNYTPSTYSNAAKGSFSIPNVGSHVWVFFREGNTGYPVYNGTNFGEEDFRSIYNMADDAYQDYPQSSENKSKQDVSSSDFNNDLYRNKYVFNQKGGTIEIINTDGREAFNLIHFSGSYFGFNNKTTTLFSANNLQSLVLGDTFQTFRGNNSLAIDRDFDMIVRGDRLIKIGNLNTEAFQAWYNAYTEIHDLKKLFEIRRVEQDGSFATITHLGLPITSFSTQDGTWATQSSKDNIVALIASKTQQLADAEAAMGRGGSEIRTITKHKVEIIGLVLNSFDSYRLDPIGKLSDYATTITVNSVYAEKKESPLVEYVDAENFPSGSFTQVITNKYKCIVGSGGYELKTTGPIDISGAIVNHVGNQVNIAAKNEMIIDGGKRLNIVADILTLQQRLGKQVNIPSNFGVSKNTVIRGGAHIEGEVSLQHITAPIEFQVTEPVHIKTTFTIRNMATTGIAQIGDSGGANQNITAGTLTGEIELSTDHTHFFRNLPLSLLEAASDVRENAADKVNADSASARGSKAILDGKKGGGAMRPTSPPNGPNSSDYGTGSNSDD